jgi:hypothetical protein
MRSLKSVAIVITLASTTMFAQSQNQPNPQADRAGQDPATQAAPAPSQADRPAGQADRPAGQAEQAPPAQAAPSTQTAPASPSAAAPSSTQADRASATSDPNSRTFIGTIVNASCPQASNLPRSGGSSSAPAASAPAASAPSTDASKSTTPAAAKDSKNPKSVYDMEREVMKHCAADNKAAAFAVLTDDGSFYKLDDAGNTQVTSAAGADAKKKNVKNMRVTVAGNVQGDTLKVQTLAKTDKPFSQ